MAVSIYGPTNASHRFEPDAFSAEVSLGMEARGYSTKFLGYGVNVVRLRQWLPDSRDIQERTNQTLPIGWAS